MFGYIKFSMIIIVIGLVVNIVGNFLFVYGGWGILVFGGVGCGIVIVLVFVVMSIVILIYICVVLRL